MGSPPQQPFFQLPGAEYFSLAPNRTIALQGRRRKFITIPQTAIPSGAIAEFQQVLALESAFVNGAGIYLHDAWMMFLPGDTAAEMQIKSSSFGLSLTNVNPVGPYQLGIPDATQETPGGGVIAMRDQEKLISQRDVAIMQEGLLGVAVTTNLYFTVVAFVENLDTLAPHSMQVFASIIYTRLDGLLE